MYAPTSPYTSHFPSSVVRINHPLSRNASSQDNQVPSFALCLCVTYTWFFLLSGLFISTTPKNAFPGGSDGKESTHEAGDLGSIPGSERSPGEGNGNPLQYSCLENLMDRGAWWATIHGVTKSQTRLKQLSNTHMFPGKSKQEKKITLLLV